MEFADILDMAFVHLAARIDLLEQKCQLNHGPNIPAPEAVDYLCQYVGKKDSSTLDMLTIPICGECIAGLYDEDWLLFYCLSCNSSQWLMKSRARNYYPAWESIRFLHTCPNCEKCPVHE